MSLSHFKRVVVRVQHRRDRPYLTLVWTDPVTRKRRSLSAGTADRHEAELVRVKLEYHLNHEPPVQEPLSPTRKAVTEGRAS